MATYLHSTVSTKRHRVRVPETPIYLEALQQSYFRPSSGRVWECRHIEPPSASSIPILIVGPKQSSPELLAELSGEKICCNSHPFGRGRIGADKIGVDRQCRLVSHDLK